MSVHDARKRVAEDSRYIQVTLYIYLYIYTETNIISKDRGTGISYNIGLTAGI